MSGIINSCVSSSILSSSSWREMRNLHIKNTTTGRKGGCGRRRFQVSCVLSNSVALDPYTILRIHNGASESEVKKAFRQLALQYHPDVCRGSSCGIEFHQINEAYIMVMNDLRRETSVYNDPNLEMDEPVMGIEDQDWDLWEEWMGWDGKEQESEIILHILILTSKKNKPRLNVLRN